MADVDLVLNTDFRKATKNINVFSREAGASLDRLKSGFNGLRNLAVAVGSAFAVKKIVDAASEQEQAIKSLNTALALTGEFSEENSQRFQDFATELQKNSTIGDEVSLSLVGLTKSMGATNEQTEKIITAAADLSAVTGESLDTSVKNITKTLGGLKGELGETQPELAGLTAEQLKAGAAIDILGTKYKGAAASLKNTFGGAMKGLNNSFGDLLEKMGDLIIKNPVIIKAVNLTAEAFDKLGEAIGSNNDAFISLSIDAIAAAVEAMAFFIRRSGEIIALLSNIDILMDGYVIAVTSLGLAYTYLWDAMIKGAKHVIDFGLSPLLNAIEGIASGLAVLGVISKDTFIEFQEGINGIKVDTATSGLEEIRDFLRETRDAAMEFGATAIGEIADTSSGFDIAAISVEKFADSLRDAKDAGAGTEKALKDLSKANAELAKAPKPFAEREFLGVKGSTITAGAGATISGITKGAQGARGLLQGGITAGAAALGLPPEIAGPLGEMAALLAQGPEQTRMMVEAFADEIPIMLENIAEALPVLIEALASKADVIVIALAEAMPRVAWALAIEVPIALAKTLPNAIGRMVTAFGEGITYEMEKLSRITMAKFWESFQVHATKFVSEFINLMGKIQGASENISRIFSNIAKLFDPLVTALSDLFLETDVVIAAMTGLVLPFEMLAEKIKEIIESPSKLDPTQADQQEFQDKVVKGVTEAAKFVATGGLSEVDRATGGNVADAINDSPVGGLFLTGGGQRAQPTQIVIQVGEKQLADVLLDLNRKGYRTA